MDLQPYSLEVLRHRKSRRPLEQQRRIKIEEEEYVQTKLVEVDDILQASLARSFHRRTTPALSDSMTVTGQRRTLRSSPTRSTIKLKPKYPQPPDDGKQRLNRKRRHSQASGRSRHYHASCSSSSKLFSTGSLDKLDSHVSANELFHARRNRGSPFQSLFPNYHSHYPNNKPLPNHSHSAENQLRLQPAFHPQHSKPRATASPAMSWHPSMAPDCIDLTMMSSEEEDNEEDEEPRTPPPPTKRTQELMSRPSHPRKHTQNSLYDDGKAERTPNMDKESRRSRGLYHDNRRDPRYPHGFVGTSDNHQRGEITERVERNQKELREVENRDLNSKASEQRDRHGQNRKRNSEHVRSPSPMRRVKQWQREVQENRPTQDQVTPCRTLENSVTPVRPTAHTASRIQSRRNETLSGGRILNGPFADDDSSDEAEASPYKLPKRRQFDKEPQSTPQRRNDGIFASVTQSKVVEPRQNEANANSRPQFDAATARKGDQDRAMVLRDHRNPEQRQQFESNRRRQVEETNSKVTERNRAPIVHAHRAQAPQQRVESNHRAQLDVAAFKPLAEKQQAKKRGADTQPKPPAECNAREDSREIQVPHIQSGADTSHLPNAPEDARLSKGGNGMVDQLEAQIDGIGSSSTNEITAEVSEVGTEEEQPDKHTSSSILPLANKAIEEELKEVDEGLDELFGGPEPEALISSRSNTAADDASNTLPEVNYDSPPSSNTLGLEAEGNQAVQSGPEENNRIEDNSIDGQSGNMQVQDGNRAEKLEEQQSMAQDAHETSAPIDESTRAQYLAQWIELGKRAGFPSVLPENVRKGGDDMDRRAEKPAKGQKSKGKKAATLTEGQRWIKDNKKIKSHSFVNAGRTIQDPEAAAALEASYLPEPDSVVQGLPALLAKRDQDTLRSDLITESDRNILAWRSSGETISAIQFKLKDVTGEQLTESEVRRRYKKAKEISDRINALDSNGGPAAADAAGASKSHDGQVIEFDQQYFDRHLDAQNTDDVLPTIPRRNKERPKLGGKQLNDAAVKAHYEDLRREREENEQIEYEEKNGFYRESSPISEEDACHWVYFIERRTWVPSEAEYQPPTDWIIVGQKQSFTSKVEAEVAASKEATRARWRVGPGWNYAKYLIKRDEDDLYNHVAELKDGSGYQIRLRRELRTSHQGTLPESKLGWFKKELYIIWKQEKTTAVPQEKSKPKPHSEDEHDDLFDEPEDDKDNEVADEPVVEEGEKEMLKGVFSILGQANKEAADYVLNRETVKSSKRIDEVTRRAAKKKELDERLDELEENHECFDGLATASQKGKKGVTVEVHVWVEEVPMTGPRNI